MPLCFVLYFIIMIFDTIEIAKIRIFKETRWDMLTYDLTQRAQLSIYEYLYQCIKQDILDG